MPGAPLPYSAIGTCLARERERAGLSQEVLARRAGLAARTVIRAEAGRGVATGTLVALGRALDLPDGWFLESAHVAGVAGGRAGRLGPEGRWLVAALEGAVAVLGEAHAESVFASLRPTVRVVLGRAGAEPPED